MISGFEGYVMRDQAERPDRLLLSLDWTGDAMGERRVSLYMLVPRPVGVGGLADINLRIPRLYEDGGNRAVFAGSYGTWRLYRR